MIGLEADTAEELELLIKKQEEAGYFVVKKWVHWFPKQIFKKQKSYHFCEMEEIKIAPEIKRNEKILFISEEIANLSESIKRLSMDYGDGTKWFLGNEMEYNPGYCVEITGKTMAMLIEDVEKRRDNKIKELEELVNEQSKSN